MKKILIIAVSVLALAAIVWLIFIRKPAVPGEITPEQAANQQTAAEAPGLGGQLYNQVQANPGSKMPETVAPVPNPIQGLYTNPF